MGDLTKNFSLWEFACHDKNNTPVPEKLKPNALALAKQLQVIRDEIGRISINSGYRTPAYNKSLPGAASQSQHLYCKAADFTSTNKTPAQMKTIILRLIKEGKLKDGGFKQYNTWVHFDTGRARRW